jgi:hypothetical protein
MELPSEANSLYGRGAMLSTQQEQQRMTEEVQMRKCRSSTLAPGNVSNRSKFKSNTNKKWSCIHLVMGGATGPDFGKWHVPDCSAL